MGDIRALSYQCSTHKSGCGTTGVVTFCSARLCHCDPCLEKPVLVSFPYIAF